MKFKLIACVAALAASTGLSYAGSGTFGFGIELDGTGASATNSGAITLYALDNSGTTRLEPQSGTPVISTAWTSASSGTTPTFNLGTYYTGDTLVLDGGSMLTFKNSGSDVTDSNLEFAIYKLGSSPGSFTQVSLLFNQDNVNGSSGDQRWATENGYTSYPQGGSGTFTPVNLLAGLGAGNYVLAVYGYADSTDGSHFESNGGLNYAAEFTVVPEPSTWAMMFGGLGMLLCFQRMRRKARA
jgi:hypothetical protein